MEKAPGDDGLENEVWKYMTGEIGEVFGRLVNNVWKNGKLSAEWNKRIISPIFKKREKSDVDNYRGVTLINTTYTYTHTKYMRIF